MAVAHKPVTAEELLKMPDEGLRSELVRGRCAGWRLRGTFTEE